MTGNQSDTTIDEPNSTDTDPSSPTDSTGAEPSGTPASPGTVQSRHGGSGDETTPRDDQPGAVASGFESSMTRYLFWGAFGLLSVLAVVATAGLYVSVSSTIDVWIGSDYEPVFRALFNLVVVLVCALGLSLLLRRIDISGST